MDNKRVQAIPLAANARALDPSRSYRSEAITRSRWSLESASGTKEKRLERYPTGSEPNEVSVSKCGTAACCWSASVGKSCQLETEGKHYPPKADRVVRGKEDSSDKEDKNRIFPLFCVSRCHNN